jgi:Dolichyl-phosphate-mannose-protein mannosyltransferase
MGVPGPDGEARTRAADKPSASSPREVARLAALAGALLTVAAYGSVGGEFYGGFALPQGSGMNSLLPAEIAAFAIFIVFGGVAWALLTVAFHGTAPVGWATNAIDAASRRRGAGLAAAVAGLLSVACWTVAHVYLRHAVTTDDEHVYRFIGQTLAAGRLTAPSPGSDLAFYREQFVVLTPQTRFGKYPIGFPALLALGQKVGAETVVVPLLIGFVALSVLWLSRRVTTPRAAVVALLLFAASPQVLLTGATVLSQPAAALCLTVGCAALVESERRLSRWPWVALAGGAFGYGLLVRPLPGALFAMVALGWLGWRGRSESAGPRVRLGAALAGPIVLAGGVLLLVNRVQVGSALSSGYQAFHATGEGVAGLRDFLGGDLALVSMSVFSSLFRLDVWLLGWPLSLLFLPFARRTGTSVLLWAMLAAELAYRLISPKAGVGGTGPVYLFEAVPLLCLLSADGAARAYSRRDGFAPERGGRVPAAMIAGALVAVTMFLPYRLADLSRMGSAQRAAPDLAAQRGLTHALIFHDGVVPPWTYRSWAYFPRCNSPALDDDLLYVRFQRSPEGGEANLDFWRRRYPDRTAWYFGWDAGGQPFLVDLPTFVRAQAGGRP